MNSILFVIDRPEPHDTSAMSGYNRTLGTIHNSIERNQSVDTLGSNVWMISADGGLPFLGIGIQAAAESHLKYRVLFLKKAPQWCNGGAD